MSEASSWVGINHPERYKRVQRALRELGEPDWNHGLLLVVTGMHAICQNAKDRAEILKQLELAERIVKDARDQTEGAPAA